MKDINLLILVFLLCSVEHGLQLSRLATENRQTSSNNLNSASSRSHCICQLELSNSALGDEKPCAMWIVDLAGSERSKRTGFGGSSKKQREAARINQSLTTLMRCITQLAGNQRNDGTKTRDNVVPFRDSKLTHLLMSHLSGSDAGRTVMIVNVNPSPTDFDETQHVLSYATVAKDIIISAKEYEKRAIVTKSARARSRSKPRPMKRSCSFTDDECSVSSVATVGSQRRQQPRKVLKPNKKLSPRQALVKKASKMLSRKNNSESESGQGQKRSRLRALSPRLKGRQLKKDDKSTLAKENHRLSRCVNHMREKIKNLEDKNSSLESENALLQSKTQSMATEMFNQEVEIRQEVVAEMEAQMKEIRNDYEVAKEDHLKQVIARAANTSMSVRKAKRDKVEAFVDELMEKVKECEDEMEVMEDRHEEEVRELKAKIAALEGKPVDSESDDEGTESEEDEDSDEEDEDDDEDSTTRRATIVQDGRIRKGRLNSEDDESLVVRLPRGRCSEVACSRESVESIEKARKEAEKKSVSPSKQVKRILRSTFSKSDTNLQPTTSLD